MDIKLFADNISDLNHKLQQTNYDWTCLETELFEDKVRCKLFYRGLVADLSKTETWTFNFDGEYNLHDNIEGMITSIWDFVNNLPTGDSLKKQALVRKMEDAARIAEELNINLDFVNPLVAMMEALATNAITHRQ